MEILTNYIDGQQASPLGGAYIDVFEPATGQVYAQAPRSQADDVEAAYQAARRAFPAWSQMPAAQRSDIMLRVAALIDNHLDELAAAESRDNGKPVGLARRMDIPRGAANFSYYATAALHIHDEAFGLPGQALSYTTHKPLGVVGCISPWNLPLYLFTWKIAPALAAGCTVVAKPSEITPYTAWRLGQLCAEAGLPPGVLNIVHGLGPEVGQAIVEHPGIKAISFTGGSATGRVLAQTAAPMLKKLSLELGGKNPALVFADADFHAAVEGVVRSSFTNQGQICLCSSRLYIERPIYDQFRDALVAQVDALKVGDPNDLSSNLGAVVSQAHFDKILSYIQLAQHEGANVLCGGQALQIPGRCANGWFVAPTLLEGLPIGCRTNQEEIFGPVVSLQPFDNEEEALALANGVDYGLSATVWTDNLRRAHRMAQALEAGLVWVNTWLLRDLRTPFGGMKQSGIGREGGTEAIRFFTEPKTICISE